MNTYVTVLFRPINTNREIICISLQLLSLFTNSVFRKPRKPISQIAFPQPITKGPAKESDLENPVAKIRTNVEKNILGS